MIIIISCIMLCLSWLHLKASQIKKRREKQFKPGSFNKKCRLLNIEACKTVVKVVSCVVCTFFFTFHRYALQQLVCKKGNRGMKGAGRSRVGEAK